MALEGVAGECLGARLGARVGLSSAAALFVLLCDALEYMLYSLDSFARWRHGTAMLSIKAR
ncbi:hypothetical protein BDY21DRAFT_343735 [Lineolata rhizophorae]|uniref:Uncharacterized protein n=1 Tax=Lineolata rhizophorae TaxID=578093 RepID=A0A6A6P073_9PEZI|nr:hypothetical protein BDY21DRAFT_343735 [Lineolata rhizophorae]